MMTGTLYKGTLYRVEIDGELSEKISLSKDTDITFLADSGNINVYKLDDGTVVYVEEQDDISSPE